MANADTPNGFSPAKNIPGVTPRTGYYLAASGKTWAEGDMLTLSGAFTQLAVAGSNVLLGVAAEPTPSGGSSTDPTARSRLAVYDDPNQTFEGQCSGTYTEGTDGVKTADIEGTTGIMEVNENATSKEVVKITSLVPKSDNADGANAKVRFVINKHELARD